MHDGLFSFIGDHLQQFFSYIVTTKFIEGEKPGQL